jgi:hypothetical protein
VSRAGYESCAEGSAEPVPRAWPTTLKRQRWGLALWANGALFSRPRPSRAAPCGLLMSSVSDPSAGAGLPDGQPAHERTELQRAGPLGRATARKQPPSGLQPRAASGLPA